MTYQTPCLLQRPARESRQWAKWTANELGKALSVTFAFGTGSAKPCTWPVNDGERFLGREAQQIPEVVWLVKALPTENTGVGGCVAVYEESQSDGSLGGAKSSSLLAALKVVQVRSSLAMTCADTPRVKNKENWANSSGITENNIIPTSSCCCPPSLFSPLPSLHFDLIFPYPFHWPWLVPQPISYHRVHTENNVDKQTSFKGLWAITYPFIKIAVLKVIFISLFLMLSSRPKQNFKEAGVKCKQRFGSGKSPGLRCLAAGGISLRPGKRFPVSFENWGPGHGLQINSLWIRTRDEIRGVVSEMLANCCCSVALYESWWTTRLESSLITQGVWATEGQADQHPNWAWPNSECWHVPFIIQGAHK